MTDVRAYLRYFQTLAAQHSSINDFFSMDINEPLAALRDGITYPALIVNSQTGKFLAANNDNTLDEIHGGFIIIDRMANHADFSTEMLILQGLKEIGTDIIARMHHDSLFVGAIQGFNVNSVTYQMIDGIFDSCAGFMFSFKITSPINLVYDPVKWSVPGIPVGRFIY
jgi:hypothetical protein